MKKSVALEEILRNTEKLKGKIRFMKLLEMPQKSRETNKLLDHNKEVGC